MKRLAFLCAALLATGVTATTAFASSNNPPGCGGGKPIVNVNYTLVNDFDSGVAGNAWANDTINRHLQIIDLGGGTYCALVNDTGSFVTFQGSSPQNTGTVSAGITGRINGGYTSTTFTGTLNTSPAYASHGNLGTFDLQCIDAYTCPGVHPSFLSYFSSQTWDGNLASWGWSYHTARNGDWVNASTGNTDDITG
jgi:hypothetical protein